MVLFLDNYDSFVHNLARYVRELGEETVVVRNDAADIADIVGLAPTHIIVSPGPGTPLEAGISNDVIRVLGATTPILGVCLGHQCIAHVFGGEVVRAPRPMHGKASAILHDGTHLFEAVPIPFIAGRYHSLTVQCSTLPPVLGVIATTADGEIMALRHREHPIWGVQFHPESILTQHGHTLLRNFLAVRAGTTPTANEIQSRRTTELVENAEGTSPEDGHSATSAPQRSLRLNSVKVVEPRRVAAMSPLTPTPGWRPQ